jgi:alpha-tubulin suppressor-like RCC1 family protein
MNLDTGSGVSGCLGHGAYDDEAQPRVVESLLSTEVIAVACGGSHVVAATSEGDIYAWGNSENGRLGIEPGEVRR